MHEVIVYVWRKGYADSEGLARLFLAKGSDYKEAVRQAYGPWAKISHIQQPTSTLPGTENFSLEYIREMSQGG